MKCDLILMAGRDAKRQCGMQVAAMLDSKNPAHKRIASRVMKAAGFVAKRGRRAALWIRVWRADVGAQKLSSPPYSLPHYIDGVTVTPESTI